MALIKCKDCKNEISKKARTCPNCGSPVKKKTSIVTWAVLALMIAALISAFSSNNEIQNDTKTESKNKNKIIEKAAVTIKYNFENELIVKAKRSVSELMKDPSSTKFKHVFFNETEKGGPVICGNYDSKNSFGAYSGFKRFISNSKTTFLEEKDKNIADIWVETCLKEKT